MGCTNVQDGDTWCFVERAQIPCGSTMSLSIDQDLTPAGPVLHNYACKEDLTTSPPTQSVPALCCSAAATPPAADAAESPTDAAQAATPDAALPVLPLATFPSPPPQSLDSAPPTSSGSTVPPVPAEPSPTAASTCNITVMSPADVAACVDIGSTPDGACTRVCSATIKQQCKDRVLFSKLLRGASECAQPYAESVQQYGWDYLNQVGCRSDTVTCFGV